jgi:FtsH-binding integral membrane protein
LAQRRVRAKSPAYRSPTAACNPRTLFLLNVSIWVLRAAALLATAALLLELRGLELRPADYAPARGSALRGSVYFFTLGMLPHKKESAHRHIPSFTVGVVFHGAAFVALALLAAPIQLPWLAILTAIGFLASLYLVGRRMLEPGVRAMSNLDDYLSTALVGLLALAATARLVLGSPAASTAHNLVGAVLFLYMPLGKLRHWLYFLLARGFLGSKLGRRGIVG